MTAVSFYPTDGRVEHFISKGMFNDRVFAVVGPDGPWRRMLSAGRIDGTSIIPQCDLLIMNTDLLGFYKEKVDHFIDVARPAFIVPYPNFEKCSCLDAPFRLQYRVLDNYRFWKRMFVRGEIDAAKVDIL